MLLAGPGPMMELEVLVTRAARQGSVHIPDLLDTFALAVQGVHPHLGDAQRLDLHALSAAIAALPASASDAACLRFVPDLHGFAHTPLAAGIGRAGRLSDDSIAWEVKDGPAALLSRIALLCLVGHEARKAQRLRASAGKKALDSTTWALAMGHDEASITAAAAQSRDELLPWLTRKAPPEIHIHPGLAPQRWAERGSRAAERIVHHLAEAGMLNRPMHLWVGPSAVTACLSPYTRELRVPLTRWAQAQTLPTDWQPAGEHPSEDALYAIARDFLRTDARLVPEKRLAERTVGITGHTLDAVECDIIDCGRLELPLCDARLSPGRGDNWSAPPPVLVRLDSGGRGLEAPCLAKLLADVGHAVASITLFTDGPVDATVSAGAHAVDAIWPWGGQAPIILPAATPLRDPLPRGALLSAPGTPAAAAWGQASQWPRLTGLPVLGAATDAASLAAAVWQALHTASDAWDIGWWHVRREPGHALPAANIATHATLAIARLRHLWWGTPRPAQTSASAAAAASAHEVPTKRGGSTAWALRIKA